MPVMLSAAEMAEVTGGRWENLTDSLVIERVEYIFHYLKEGDFYVCRTSKWDRVPAALDKGIAALMLNEKCPHRPDIPVLRVENTYSALRKLAIASSGKSEAKRVLVTGSYGKTGFKYHLKQVLDTQMTVSVRHGSANYPRSLYCHLASLRPEDELAIVEMPVSTAKKMARRSGYVRPDICVITSIGHEHIERFGSVENIIANKTKIAEGLKPGGRFLIPRDDPHYRQLKKALDGYGHFDLLTFGSDRSCDARLLYKNYNAFGWDLIARIEDIVAAYRVPFPEIHEPSASLAVLLGVYHLGGDVRKSAEVFYRCRNFKSSGKLYEVTDGRKRFYLYNQSYRGGIEGYEQFFRTVAQLTPEKKAKKILLTSEFVDYADGEMALIDTEKFRNLIADAGFDLIFSIEKFPEHFQVLPDCRKWRRHSVDLDNIKEEVLAGVEDGDILCVKGIFESRMPGFVRWLREEKKFRFRSVGNTDGVSGWQAALHSLRPLSLKDGERYRRALEATGKRGWIAYFPFLITWGASSSRELLVDGSEETMNLYLFRRFGRSEPPRFDLLTVMPMRDGTALQKALERLYEYNGKNRGRILWVEAEEKTFLENTFGRHASVRVEDRNMDEYLYDPKRYESLAGTKFRHLRKEVQLVRSLPEPVEVLPYEPVMREECLNLLEEWEALQGGKYGRLEDRTYTRNTLKMYDEFSRDELFGIVVRIGGKIRSFGFAGKIREGVGSFYIGKSDLSVRGLHSFMRYELLRRMTEYERVNDSYALGEGMAFSKRMFRPVEMLKQYRAVIRKNGA